MPDQETLTITVAAHNFGFDIPFELLDGKPLFPPEPKPRRRWFRQAKTQAPVAPDPQPVSESHAS